MQIKILWINIRITLELTVLITLGSVKFVLRMVDAFCGNNMRAIQVH